ncbi:hypothetical protein ILUMI_23914 [Ignelater luminosus]|uniref:Major facilitator superfamily (MFS) profile domain-containing protein n=1 Tax=Ignelater luminosus TaxID=2038154 RepID=A0A8K0CB80_IGNLU|nr:hypothetical protein ILUMI_23914 [Ignelater luminosus]
MASINIKLYTICFLDAVTVGFILPILSYHIFALGGSHTTLGVLGSFYAAFQIISGPLIRTWRDTLGKKFALLCSLFINFITYLPLGITTSSAIIVLLRVVCALTNQTQTLCKAFVVESSPQEKHASVYNVMNALSVAGFVIGPIIGGQIYELENGFYYISMLASLMLAICLLICLTLPTTSISTSSDNQTTFLQKIKEDIEYSLSNLQSINMHQQWDVIMLRSLYHISITVFFIKFSMLLKLHYSASATIVGYTYGYQSILTFLSLFVVAFIKQKSSTDFFISSLFAVTLGFFGLCYASTYDNYLIIFIPTVITHTLINGNWKQLFKLRSTKEHNIEAAEETVAKIVGIITPIIFGIFCDLYGHYALKAFVILPLIFDIFVTLVFNSNVAKMVIEKEKVTEKKED